MCSSGIPWLDPQSYQVDERSYQVKHTDEVGRLQEIPILVHLEPISRLQPATLDERFPRGFLVVPIPAHDVSATEVQLTNFTNIGLCTVVANYACFLPREENPSAFDNSGTPEDTFDG